MSKIAFVIPVFNRLKYTQECLTILNQQKSTHFFKENEISIIVSDDGSQDGTEAWIHENFPEVIILKGTGNLWYSGSMNLGIRYALENLKSDFIMVWENDIYPINNYFNNLQEILENWDTKTVICSKLYYKSHPEIIFGMGGTFDVKTGKKTLIGRTKSDGPEYHNMMEVDWFLGQGVLIHKDILAQVGLFDEVNFPQYHADVDYSLRAKKAGFKNIVYPNLQLLNDTSMTGISHVKDKTLKQFFTSLVSIRSNTNIFKDIKFYQIHTTNYRAYLALMERYFIYIGSYFKWKFLGYLGIRKKNEELY